MNSKINLNEFLNQHINCKKNSIAGNVSAIKYGPKNEAQYIILTTNYFAGKKERSFAIPALPAFMEINQSGELTLTVSREDLALAKRIHFDDCPTIKANKFFPSIYEVYGLEIATTLKPRKKVS